MRAGSFAVQLLVRVAALFGLLAVLAYVVTSTDFHAVALVAGAITVIQAGLLIRFVGRTNRELARFLDGIRYDDFLQSFSNRELGAGFDEMGLALEQAMHRFRAARLSDEARRRYLEALVEQVPVALLSVHDDGTVELLNSAARRLLNASSRTSLDALAAYGESFRRDIAQSRPGGRTLTRTEIDGIERHLVLSTTQIIAGSSSQRVTSLQDIQTELDTNELSAWQDMVRVISHEIMNSLTPIASLARTADEIVADLAAKAGADQSRAAELVDLRDAVQTLSRRSTGLLRFVRSYRQLTQMPPPSLHSLAMGEYLHRLDKLLESEWSGRGIQMHLRHPPEGLEILADENLLDQAMINLLRNAADAAASNEQPQVWLTGGLSERGRPIIEIADNGRGFDDETRDKIFLPFFTTKPDGSGIGLALARQIMLVHKGAITAGPRPGGGAVFRLTF